MGLGVPLAEWVNFIFECVWIDGVCDVFVFGGITIKPGGQGWNAYRMTVVCQTVVWQLMCLSLLWLVLSRRVFFIVRFIIGTRSSRWNFLLVSWVSTGDTNRYGSQHSNHVSSGKEIQNACWIWKTVLPLLTNHAIMVSLTLQWRLRIPSQAKGSVKYRRNPWFTRRNPRELTPVGLAYMRPVSPATSKLHIRRMPRNAHQIISYWLTNPALTIQDNCFAEQPSGSQHQQQFESTTTQTNMLRWYKSMTISTTTWSATKLTEWLLYITIYIVSMILQGQTEDHQWY